MTEDETTVTEMLERYLDAVRRNLPARMRADVVAELHDDLRSHIEEREDSVGRALTTEELSGLLRSYGHPLVVASRYRPAQWLIGPTSFPFYVRALKMIAIVVVAGTLAAWAIDALLGNPPAGARAAWWPFWEPLLAGFALVTLAFALLERVPGGTPIGHWDPRKLPARQGPRSVPRLKTGFELFANLLAAMLMLGVPGVRAAALSLFVQPNLARALPFALTDAWWRVFFVYGCGALAVVVLDVVMLVRPEWYRLRSATLAGISAILAVTVAWLTRGVGPYVVPDASVLHAARYTAAAQTLDSLAYASLVVGIAITAAIALWNLYLTLRRPLGDDRARARGLSAD